MLGKLRLTLLGSGAVLMMAAGLGLLVYNARWTTFGEVKAWARQWKTPHEKVYDCACSGAAFALFSVCASIVGIVFLMIGFNRFVTSIVFTVAIVMFVIEMIPEGLILGSCRVFDGDASLWVDNNKRNYYDNDETYRAWVDAFWPKQLAHVGTIGAHVRTLTGALATIGGIWFQVPQTEDWIEQYTAFIPRSFYHSDTESSSYAFSCIVDLDPAQTVYDYRSASDGSICSSLKVTTVECVGGWSAGGLESELKRECEVYWDMIARMNANGSADDYSEAMDKGALITTNKQIQQSISSLYMVNSLFFGVQMVAAYFISGGIILSFITKEEE